jgi:hypothetical protein
LKTGAKLGKDTPFTISMLLLDENLFDTSSRFLFSHIMCVYTSNISISDNVPKTNSTCNLRFDSNGGEEKKNL